MNKSFFTWVLTGFIGALASTLGADPVPVADVVAAARGWLALNRAAPLDSNMGTELSFLAPVPDRRGTVLYYVATLEAGGTMVLSPDDALEPVVAFSEGTLDLLDSDPCNHLRLMLEHDMAARLADARAGAVKGAPAKAGKWALLVAASKDPLGVKAGLGSVSDVRVMPLIRTKWSQSYVYQGSSRLACYNYFTPPYTAGAYQNYYCGCVATALAQIMRYHQHPKTGLGTRTFNIHLNGTLYTDTLEGGNGSGGRYDWASMPDDPAALARAGKLSLAQRMAIGYICHDAGVASGMSYYSDGSSAPICWSEGNHPLQSVFRYASVDSPWTSSGNTFLKKDINTAVNPCLDAGLPCALAITADKGTVGHAIVADGYGYSYGVLYHHLNMGWSGNENAWYNLPRVSVSSRTYLRVEGLVFNIHPTLQNAAVISGRMVDGAGKPLAGVKVVAKDTAGIRPNQSTLSNSRGIYALVVPGGEYKISGLLPGYGFSPEAKILAVGSGTFRNSWNNTFTRVTRIMRLSTAKLSFGRVSLGTSKILRFKVFNDGTAPLSVGSVQCPPEFSVSPLPPFSVPALGGLQAVDVTFTPATTNLVKGTLMIKSNRSGGVSQLAVSGTGF